MFKIVQLIILLLLLSFNAHAGDTTVIKKDKWVDYVHKPKVSALWSLLPGAGQFYNELGYRRVSQKKNRAWWKIPIIYGGLGACGYYFYYNYSRGHKIKEELLFRREFGDSTNLHPELINYSSESALINGYSAGNNIYQGFDLYSKRRDIFIAASIGIYALNIIEAFVDGHFVSFNVSEDLGLSCFPVMFDKYTPGISLTLSFN